MTGGRRPAAAEEGPGGSPLRSVCVFAGSREGGKAEYAEAARRLGRELADAGLDLVFGGGRWGLMGEVAGAALEGGGEVVGVIPESLVEKEGRHPDLTRLEVVASMHDRKARMAEMADGFVSLPGGLGTLEETCEMLAWSQLGFHGKPSGLLNAAGYFDPLVRFLDVAVEEGFVDPEDRELLEVESDPRLLIRRLRDRRLPRRSVSR